jgi:hypothetical protein
MTTIRIHPRPLVHGTAHFVNYRAALEYYLPYNGGDGIETKRDVDRKIRKREIYIGKPRDIPAGAKLIVIDGGTRYGIEEWVWR